MGLQPIQEGGCVQLPQDIDLQRTKALAQRAKAVFRLPKLLEPPSKLLPAASLIGASLGCILALWFRGSFILQVASSVALFYVALPANLVGAMLLLVLKHRPLSVALLALAVTILNAFPLTTWLSNRLGASDVEHAQEFCETLIPRLEEYKVPHGRYPDAKTVGAWVRMERLPILLNRDFFFASGERAFSFEFKDPREVMGLWRYRSDERRWHHRL